MCVCKQNCKIHRNMGTPRIILHLICSCRIRSCATTAAPYPARLTMLIGRRSDWSTSTQSRRCPRADRPSRRRSMRLVTKTFNRNINKENKSTIFSARLVITICFGVILSVEITGRVEAIAQNPTTNFVQNSGYKTLNSTSYILVLCFRFNSRDIILSVHSRLLKFFLIQSSWLYPQT